VQLDALLDQYSGTVFIFILIKNSNGQASIGLISCSELIFYVNVNMADAVQLDFTMLKRSIKQMFYE